MKPVGRSALGPLFVLGLLLSIVAAQDAGIGRQSIETLDMPAGVIRKTGAETWLAFVHWARPRAFSPLYKLLCYLLPTQAERTGK